MYRKYAHENTLKTMSHEGNGNQSHDNILLHTNWDGCNEKDRQ